MTALEVVRAAPGLDDYLAEVETELQRAVEHYRGIVAEVGASALAAGGKRLRPALAPKRIPGQRTKGLSVDDF